MCMQFYLFFISFFIIIIIHLFIYHARLLVYCSRLLYLFFFYPFLPCSFLHTPDYLPLFIRSFLRLWFPLHSAPFSFSHCFLHCHFCYPVFSQSFIVIYTAMYCYLSSIPFLPHFTFCSLLLIRFGVITIVSFWLSYFFSSCFFEYSFTLLSFPLALLPPHSFTYYFYYICFSFSFLPALFPRVFIYISTVCLLVFFLLAQLCSFFLPLLFITTVLDSLTLILTDVPGFHYDCPPPLPHKEGLMGSFTCVSPSILQPTYVL